MSAFEDFVQLELPKRPFTEADPAPESILIRRGPGPRQAVGVPLASDGDIVVFSAGSITTSSVDAELTNVDGGFY